MDMEESGSLAPPEIAEPRLDPTSGSGMVIKSLAIYDGGGSPTGKRRNLVITDIFGGHEAIVSIDEWRTWELAA